MYHETEDQFSKQMLHLGLADIIKKGRKQVSGGEATNKEKKSDIKGLTVLARK